MSSSAEFLKAFVVVVLGMTALFVVAGAAAYHFLLRPDDSFWKAIHRASMIVSGMGRLSSRMTVMRESSSTFMHCFRLLCLRSSLVSY